MLIHNEKSFVDPPCDLDPLQNVMGSKLAHAAPLHWVSSDW